MDVSMAAEAAAAGSDGGGYWQLALVLAAIGFLGLFARWRKACQPPVRTAREIRGMDTEPNRHRDAADKALVELLETSRVLNAQVDTKIRLLNRLVKEAEEQAARLERALAAARELRSGHSQKTASPAPAAESRVDFVPDTPAAPEFQSELHERVYRLAREGGSVAEIAKATNLSTTEVEFFTGVTGEKEENA